MKYGSYFTQKKVKLKKLLHTCTLEVKLDFVHFALRQIMSFKETKKKHDNDCITSFICSGFNLDKYTVHTVHILVCFGPQKIFKIMLEKETSKLEMCGQSSCSS